MMGLNSYRGETATRAPWEGATVSSRYLPSPIESWLEEVSIGIRNLLVPRIGVQNVAEATATVKMDEQGRCYIPKAAREKLGIDGEEVTVELTVRYDG